MLLCEYVPKWVSFLSLTPAGTAILRGGLQCWAGAACRLVWR